MSVLPYGVRVISYALSPTYAIELMRMAIWGVTDKAVFIEKLGILLGLTVVYAIFSVILYRRIDKRVRIAATLEVA